MIVNVITRPVMKLEYPEDLSFFYKCRTFLYKKILSGYVRVLDLSSFLPPLLNNVGLKSIVCSTNVRFPFFVPANLHDIKQSIVELNVDSRQTHK